MLLINAVKDVAAALGELISATKNASGKSAQDPTMSTLKDSAKVGGLPAPAGLGVGVVLCPKVLSQTGGFPKEHLPLIENVNNSTSLSKMGEKREKRVFYFLLFFMCIPEHLMCNIPPSNLKGKRVCSTSRPVLGQ